MMILLPQNKGLCGSGGGFDLLDIKAEVQTHPLLLVLECSPHVATMAYPSGLPRFGFPSIFLENYLDRSLLFSSSLLLYVFPSHWIV